MENIWEMIKASLLGRLTTRVMEFIIALWFGLAIAGLFRPWTSNY